MTKKYANTALIYSILAMIFGVFYREFTKFNSFFEKTQLSFIHTHYFVLGMIFFLILMLVEKNCMFSDSKTNKYVLFYNIGLNISVFGLFIRGTSSILSMDMTKALNASISGISGIGYNNEYKYDNDIK